MNLDMEAEDGVREQQHGIILCGSIFVSLSFSYLILQWGMQSQKREVGGDMTR